MLKYKYFYIIYYTRENKLNVYYKRKNQQTNTWVIQLFNNIKKKEKMAHR